MSESKWYLRTQDETFGPETEAKLVEWAKLGRIQPGQEISDDNIQWRRVEDIPFLDMRFSIDIGDGNPRGPFHRAAAEALLASGRLPMTASLVETRAPFESVDEVETVEEVEKVEAVEEVEEVDEPDKAEETPAAAGEPQESERIVEKIVEKEVRVEVPVEKIVEKVVVDETRVKELEGLLEEERRHTADLQSRLDESSRNAAEAAKAATVRENELRMQLGNYDTQVKNLENGLKDAAERESKYSEQVAALEDELRRLPQAASEVADVQAAVYSIITSEVKKLEDLLDVERREFEEIKRRYAERADRLAECRRELLKRAGSNIEDMTRKALLSRPEDPRMIQLRKELETLRREHDQTMLNHQDEIKELTVRFQQQKIVEKRAAEREKDMAEIQAEAQDLRERLQQREKELLEERQRNEELVRQQATKQQVLLARLASLESPSIGSSRTMSTNQSREAKQVKLAGWMSLRR